MVEQAHSRDHRPLRTLTFLAGGALVLLVALVGSSARGDAPAADWYQRLVARADTDSVAINPALLDTDAVLNMGSFIAPADTDSVFIGLDSLRAVIDSLGTDSLRARADSLAPEALRALADSLAQTDSMLVQADTNYRVQKYLSGRRHDSRAASLFPRQKRPLSTTLGSYWRHDLQLDSTGQYYVARETVGEEDVRYPTLVTRDQYRQQRLTTSLNRNWDQLVEQRTRQRLQQQRGGLGLNITVPGGRQSTFTTIFGKNEVDLRVTGQADIRAGFDYRKSEQQVTLGRDSQIDPDFKQDLSLGVTGTIGDKMRVDVNWDTNREFDFQNQLKLTYTGYEDEILQSVEAGNVFLQTPSTLIRGGQSLFGIKSELQLGGVRLTTVASQQEGQSNNLSLEGGAESTEFSLKPTDYNQRKHYFVSYYFRNRWNEALSDPSRGILVDGRFQRIDQIEVWKVTSSPSAPEEQNLRQAVALVDLGESQELLTQADGFTRAELPNPDIDQYDPSELDALRPGNAVPGPKDILESNTMDVPLSSDDFQVSQFKKLIQGSDYQVDEILGYITLNAALAEGEALAIAYKYIDNGATVQIGDFSSDTGGGDNSQLSDRLVLKLLKPINLKQPSGTLNPAAWYLEMRNIYRIGLGLNPNEFELEVTYEPPGQTSSRTLPGVTGQQTLLQSLGLDRVNENGSARPDNKFDFLPNYTINQSDGLLIFPYLEPFGNRISALIEENVPEAEQPEVRDQFVFNDLYTQKKENALRNTQLNVYRIGGSYKGSVNSFYDLKAFSGVIPGSVRVTSGGVALTEGVDFTVDYTGGTVSITNPSYLTAGRNIEIDYEQNKLIDLQKKTLLGARVDYQTSDRFAFGGTLMRLSQRSVTDKFRLGEEPISNTIWGVDGSLNLEPRWMTRAIDALPLLQTREPSTITITGEFAQLLPGHSQTNAFENTQRDLRDDGLSFKPDEQDGISYLDDFESFENTLPLMAPGRWFLSAAPIDSLTDSPLSNDQRAGFTWYQLNNNTQRDLIEDGAVVRGDANAVKIFDPQEVFPNRQTSSQERFITTLDMYFTPHERGPYNHNGDLGNSLDNPKETWGGMTQRLSEGYTDFTLKNIEFVEFVFQPFAEEGEANPDAKLFVDLGQISEDVIRDAKLNTEDGLSLTDPGNNFSSNGEQQFRLGSNQQDQVVNPIPSGQRMTEDLGLDGIASFPNNDFEGTRGDETFNYSDFLGALGSSTSSSPFLAREIAKAQQDPSGDDYHHYLDASFYKSSTFYPNGSTIQERFLHFFPGQELNSIEGQSKLSNSSGTNVRGNAKLPDTEDLNLNSTLDNDNSYFQYELPLNLTALDELARPDQTDDFVIEEIREGDGDGTGWYLVRIPVKDFDRRVGDIADFTGIESIRLWTKGLTNPATLRFATLELVGSQWRKSDTVTNETEAGIDTPLPPPIDTDVEIPDESRVSISSVNNEENSDYAIPNGTIINQIREVSGGAPRDAREQSMVVEAENVRPGKQQAIFQTYNQGQDLLKYKNLRMFVHLHGIVDGRQLTEEDRDKVTLFVRLGANESSDYYEYEQPLTPSPLDRLADLPDNNTLRADYLWRTNQEVGGETIDLNSMNIVLSALNKLKFERDDRGAPRDTVFWSNDNMTLDEIIGTSNFAPPGTRVGIKGTPSLSNVNTIVVGVRNKDLDDDGTVLEEVTIWINELRVAGYDEDPGISGLVNADFKLADLGRIKANFRTQSDGFGGLESTLGEREQTNLQDWAVNTQFNVDKFIPERFGWSIPITMEVKSNTTTPRYDPARGDIEVQSLLETIDANEELTDAEKQERKDLIVEQSQTYRFTRSFTSRLQKRGSRSRLLRNTLDGTSISYSYTDQDGRSPNNVLNDSWQWNTAIDYRLNVRKPRVFRPFGFLGDLPIIGVLGGLNFNYLPNSLSLGASATRRYSVTKERPDPLRNPLPDALGAELTEAELDLISGAVFPLRPQHTFTHRRQFGLQYNPFGFLNFSLDTNTDQSLNDLGTIVDSTTVLIDEEGVPVLDNRPISALLADSTITRQDVGATAFSQQDLQVRPVDNVINDILGGNAPRTERYESRINTTFRPRLDKISFLNWISLQDVGYATTFNWRNGSVDNNLGATVGTNVTLRGGVTLRPKNMFEKFGFYRSIQEDQQAAEQAAQQRRQEREQAKQERKEERERQREQERLLEEAREEAAARGEELPEEPLEEDPLVEDPSVEELDEEEEETGLPVLTPEGEEVAADTTESEGGGFRLPLPNPVSIMRQLFLGVTGIDDFRLTYNGSRRSESTNVGSIDDETNETVVNYSLLDAAFRGQGPSLGYRFGLDREIDDTQRIISDRVQVTDAFTDQNRFQGSTRLSLTSNLQVNLNWNVEWTERDNVTYRTIDTTSTTITGDNKASVWAFGASYVDLISKQLATYRADAVNQDSLGNIRSTVLTNASVSNDFLSSYMTSLGSLGQDGRLPFPLPGWQVTYSGISKWPLIRSLTQTASLRHGYSADYGLDFRSNLSPNPTGEFNLQDGPTIIYDVSPIEVGAVRVNERFQPLIGLDLTFKGNIQTSLAWNTGTSYALTTTTNQVSETETSEITFTANYQKQGLSLPFLPGKRLNNRIGFSLTLSRSTNNDRNFNIKNALEEAASRGPDEDPFQPEEVLIEGSDFGVQVLTSQSRITVAPKITYQFSNRVSADAFVRYENFMSEDGRRPPTTNVNGGFNVRVSISN